MREYTPWKTTFWVKPIFRYYEGVWIQNGYTYIKKPSNMERLTEIADGVARL